MLMIKRHVQTLIGKGAFTKAIGVAVEYARRNPESAASHQLVAITEEAAGYTKAAIQSITYAINLAPAEPSIRIMRARLLIKDKHLKEAIADIDAIIAMSDARRDDRFLDEAIACRDELLERMSSSRQTVKPHKAPAVVLCGLRHFSLTKNMAHIAGSSTLEQRI